MIRRTFHKITTTIAAVFLCVTANAQRGSVDTDISVGDQEDADTYVLIIANENYQFEQPVPFALNDGAVMKRYFEKTIGVPEKNIRLVADGTLNVMKYNLTWLEKIMTVKKGQARCFFYYSGHGMPDEASKQAYLLPVDGFSTEPSTGFSTQELYKRLGAMPSRATVVLLDACFSGANREGGMMQSSRGVAIKPRENAVEGNMVVFSAAQGNETAYPLKDKEHGLFTYYILEKLQETDGSITLGNLSDFVTDKVGTVSLDTNGKSQTPSLKGPETGNEWRSWPMAKQAATRHVNFPKPIIAKGSSPASAATSAAPAVQEKPTQNGKLDMAGSGAFALAGGVIYEMARIDQATFAMGMEESLNSFSTFSMSKPVHQVTLHPYAIGKQEVSQALWQAVMGNNPSENKNADSPVDNVTWEECQRFLTKLNAMCGMNFRLPTEAEWEYAALCAEKYNTSGLAGMTSGVDEWCQDYYARYSQMNQTNPKGPSMGFQRVVRGAAQGHTPRNLRKSQRGHMRPDEKSPQVGLRLVHDL
jgi:formylglycine-generating enzyme required for sulfatase activity